MCSLPLADFINCCAISRVQKVNSSGQLNHQNVTHDAVLVDDTNAAEAQEAVTNDTSGVLLDVSRKVVMNM